MIDYQVPFNRATTASRSGEYVQEVLAHGPLAGGGRFSRRCEEILTAAVGAKASLLTSSCTDALEMSALLLDIAPGDEVIVPSFTFSSTATAFTLRGATPVFADVRSDTLNLDEALLEELITPRTRAVAVVHYAGVACEMNTITDICRSANIPVVEDNAHGLYGYYFDRPLGSLGSLATQSFHETKNITCGEGGALIINDPSLIDRAEILREKGTNRARFFRGQVDKYTWVDNGSSFLPSEVTAALLLAQLEEASQIQEKRKRVWDRYYESLHDWADKMGVMLPRVPSEHIQAYHLFHLVMPTQRSQELFRAHLAAEGLLAVTHYVPLHSSPFGRRIGRGDCPVTEDLAGRLVRLPFYTDITYDDVNRVVDAVVSFTG